MFATDRLHEGSRGCSGTLSDYTTPDSRAKNRTPGDLRLRPPDNVTVGHCSIVFLVKRIIGTVETDDDRLVENANEASVTQKYKAIVDTENICQLLIILNWKIIMIAQLIVAQVLVNKQLYADCTSAPLTNPFL